MSQLVPSSVLESELGLSRSTLWRLRRQGLPCLKVGGSIRFQLEEVRAWLEGQGSARVSQLPLGLADDASTFDQPQDSDALPPCHWSVAVALDPKHRPQIPSSPSSTVRRDWRKYPQEAHLLDQRSHRYRRLTEDEIAVIQGFPSDWAKGIGLTHRERIAGLGNAIPPPLGKALYAGIGRILGDGKRYKTVEICAGFGGLALGGHLAGNIDPIAFVEFWDAAVHVLKSSDHWDASRVFLADVKKFDWSGLRGRVDILSGGPPCQPWSSAGLAKGADDERDLLGYMPQLINEVKPRAFFFENVPGLTSPTHRTYLQDLVLQLRNEGEYGVAVGTVQAADYGVPQRRKRVVIAGFKGLSVGAAHDYFDVVSSLRTHSDPQKAIPLGRRPWVTLAEALPTWSEGHGWRRWIDETQVKEQLA